MVKRRERRAPATKLAVGYRLDDRENDITRQSTTTPPPCALLPLPPITVKQAPFRFVTAQPFESGAFEEGIRHG